MSDPNYCRECVKHQIRLGEMIGKINLLYGERAHLQSIAYRAISIIRGLMNSRPYSAIEAFSFLKAWKKNPL